MGWEFESPPCHGLVVGATRSFHEHVVEDFTPADELGVGLTHFPPLLCNEELLWVEQRKP